jgi:hypothetical protein
MTHSRHVAKAHVAPHEVSCLTRALGSAEVPCFLLCSLDLLGSQKLINFLHNEVVWMFEAVFFKLIDTL